MDITYDKEADAVYIRLKKGVVFKTRPINDLTMVDLDKDNDVLGLELLDASKRLSKKDVSEVHVKNMVAIATE